MRVGVTQSHQTMSEIQTDPTTLIDSYSPSDKDALFAVLARDVIARRGPGVVPITDHNATIAYLMPSTGRPEKIPPGCTDPYVLELERRAGSSQNAIPLDRFISEFERADD
jgi:hypothetical protein